MKWFPLALLLAGCASVPRPDAWVSVTATSEPQWTWLERYEEYSRSRHNGLDAGLYLYWDYFHISTTVPVGGTAKMYELSISFPLLAP